MKTTQLHYQSGKWINIPTKKEANPLKAQLVLVFGAGIVVGDAQVYDYVKNYFPHADIISCSTSGEILADNVYDDTAVVTAIQLEKSSVKAVLQKVSSGVNSYETGKSIMQQLEAENLASILVLSEGSFINGSELVNGLNELNTKQVPITGGLAGDAARFERTQVGLNAPATEGNVVAIGFYGNEVKIGHSSFGGWDEFGKERIITKSDKNVLYEIDGETALDLYKQYLGPYVNELPGSALLFPLSMRLDDSGKNLVRTILTIDEDKKTMTFAGNLPEGARVRLMKANFEKIIEGSSIAAAKSVETGQKQFPELAILISCVGRKLILQDRTSEEVQAARNIFGDTTSITGFYSYGEISPFNPHTNCELHNQTMTITTFSESTIGYAMSYHPILEKNIQKLLPQELLSIEAVQQLLAAISRNFTSFERDKKITEHAFDVSETEYQQATRDLKTQNEIRKESIKKLKQAIRSLDPKAPQQFSDDDNDLIHIISFLEDQIRKTKALEQELINAKNAAEKAAMAKSEFLSVMSHEIRTPLNAIIGTIMLLQYQDLQPDQKELLNVMEISAENLLSLINDVLDYSKLEEGKIIFAERNINILHFLKNIKMANRVKAEEKGNLIKVIYDDDIPEFVVGDDVRLGQILNNLVSNAVKFTKEGTITIRVELKKSCKTDLELGFSIEDTGIGIPKEKQELIFERFTQANNNITREFGGSGLGLTIIRRLLQLQGSDIFIDSEPGIGSRFFFNLKFKKSTTEIREEAKQSGDLKFDLSGTHILLVEDVEFNVMVAQRMLRNWHATVDHAENGAVAVEKVKSNEYDLVLMDIQMPIMDGYTATNEIRKFNMALPIIALTASIITPDIQGRAVEAGMNDCITKPFNPNDLYSIIAEKSRKKK